MSWTQEANLQVTAPDCGSSGFASDQEPICGVRSTHCKDMILKKGKGLRVREELHHSGSWRKPLLHRSNNMLTDIFPSILAI